MIIVGSGWELNSKSVRETRQERFCSRTCNLVCDWWCWLGFKSRPNLRLSRGSSQIWARFEYHDGYQESDPITLFWRTKDGNKTWVMRGREISLPHPSCCSCSLSPCCSIPSCAHQTLGLPFVKPSENKTPPALMHASGGEYIMTCFMCGVSGAVVRANTANDWPVAPVPALLISHQSRSSLSNKQKAALSGGWQ